MFADWFESSTTIVPHTMPRGHLHRSRPPLATLDRQIAFLKEGLRRAKKTVKNIDIEEWRHHLVWWLEELKEGHLAIEWRWAAENVGLTEGCRRARRTTGVGKGVTPQQEDEVTPQPGEAVTEAEYGRYTGVAGWEGYGENRRWRAAWEDDFLEGGPARVERRSEEDGYESDITDFEDYEVEAGPQGVVQQLFMGDARLAEAEARLDEVEEGLAEAAARLDEVERLIEEGRFAEMEELLAEVKEGLAELGLSEPKVQVEYDGDSDGSSDSEDDDFWE